MATKRPSETPSETLCQNEKKQMAKQRTLESQSYTVCRQKRNRNHMAGKRTTKVSIDDAISAFISKIKMGRDFVCTWYRMMYRWFYHLTNLSILKQDSLPEPQSLWIMASSLLDVAGMGTLGINCKTRQFLFR